MVGIIAGRHHPVLGVLGQFRKIVIRLRSRRDHRRYRDERAGSEQACKPKFSHVSPPVSEARVSSSRDGHIAMPPSATATLGLIFSGSVSRPQRGITGQGCQPRQSSRTIALPNTIVLEAGDEVRLCRFQERCNHFVARTLVLRRCGFALRRKRRRTVVAASDASRRQDREPRHKGHSCAKS